VGQEHVVRTLRNAVEQSKVHHAYLFVGSRGTGKTSMAKILAACLNCERGPTTRPCGRCESCTSIASATSLDVIEMDAASNNSVDDIRELREKVAYAPVSGRHKVYILDEAHMLSSQAWNAFLKTLEEPPPRTIFVLATTEAQKVLPTVVDRCHRFDFGRPTVEQVATVLVRVAAEEQIRISEAALALVARHATGSFRDALGTLEQLVTYAGEEQIEPADVLAVLGIADSEQLFAAVEAIVARDPAEAMRAAARLAESGRDPGQVLRDLEIHGRELLTVQVLGEVPPELRVTPERDRRMAEQASALSRTDAVRLLDLVSGALEATANGAQARIQLELVLVKAAAPELDPSTQALMARIERLESGDGAAPPSSLRSITVAVTPEQTGGPPQLQAPSAAAPARPVAAPSSVRVTSSSASATAQPASATAQAASAPAPAQSAPAPAQSAPAPAQSAPAPAQSAPAPAVAEPQERPAVSLEVGTATELWPAVVDTVRAGNAMLAALLADARPVIVTERELTLAFPSGAAFLKRKAEQDEHRRVTAEAFRSVTGHTLVLRYELRDEEETPAEPGETVLTGEKLVQRFMDEFNAEELLDDPDQPEDK
jgi:DNA polymerase III subunit gamma/tau